jgi:hypothetical protein
VQGLQQVFSDAAVAFLTQLKAGSVVFAPQAAARRCIFVIAL